jgi:hypothetical protein
MGIKKFNKFLVKEENNTELYQKGDYYWLFISELNEWIPGMYDGGGVWMIIGSDEIFSNEEGYYNEIEVGKKIDNPYK